MGDVFTGKCLALSLANSLNLKVVRACYILVLCIKILGVTVNMIRELKFVVTDFLHRPI